MTLLNIWQYHYASDFAKGVKLLVSHEGNKHLTKQAFERLQRLAISGDYVDAYNLGKLTGALNKIAVEGAYEAPVMPKMAKPIEVPSDLADSHEDSPLPELKASAKAIELHKEQSHHHALMVSAENDKDRAEHAGKILEIASALDREYDRIRAQANPTAIDDKDHQTTRKDQGADKLRKLQSLRTRISQITRKHLPKATGKRKADLEKELQMKQAEVQRLENDLA